MQVHSYISVKAKPFVSIITLNWNQTNATCQFLESTSKLTYDHYEVLVCDLGSSVDPTFAIASGGYKNVRLLNVEGDQTQRLSRAISNAKGDFVLLLNNNNIVTERLIEELLQPFRENNTLGAVCPKVVSYKNPNEICFAGYKRTNPFTGKSRIIGDRQTDKGQYNTPALIHGINSGAVMIRKSILENSDLFSENYFVYFNDADISARIIKRGFKILYQPDALVYNNDAIRYERKSSLHIYYTTRNRILSMRRNTTLFQFSVFMLVFLFLGIPVTAIKFACLGQFAHLRAFFKGIAWNFKPNSLSSILVSLK